MNARTLIAAACVLGFTLACTGADTTIEIPEVPVVELSVEAKAADVAKAVAADPAKADEALATAGFTAEEFDELMYEIAMDPARSKEYMTARGM